MLIYSQTTQTFRKKLKSFAKEIISKEVGLKFHSNRFEYKGMLIPLNFVVFEDPTKLGYYNSKLYQIALNKDLIYQAKDSVLRDILRHEIAHMMTHLDYGDQVAHHGEEFKKVCKKFNWNDEVYKAYMNVEKANESKEGDISSEKVLSRIKKLMSLASSENLHEAEAATLKANELLLKHNLKSIDQSIEQEDVYVKRVLEGKRKSAKHIAIYEILATFNVQPVFNHAKGHYYLEVVGTKLNVELCDYVAHTLDSDLEELWKQAKKENQSLKGQVAKNSYFKGVAKGYIEKIEEQKQSSISSRDLVILKNELERQTRFVYSRLGSSVSKSKTNFESSNAGKKAGRNLSFKKALKNQVSKTLSLPWK